MRILYLAILALMCGGAFAQPGGIFRIDSLPPEGVLLDKGWKWHAGDDPEWANAEYDDSEWEEIDPTKDIFKLPQLSKSGKIGWFRIQISLNKSIPEQVVFNLNQSGASEVYLNGELTYRYGTLSHNPKEIKAYTPQSKFTFINMPDSNIVIAFRYSLQPHIHYTQLLSRKNPAIQISLYSPETFTTIQFSTNSSRNKYPVIFRVGASLMLCIIYFSFFIFHTQQKTNLLFFVFSFLGLLCDFGNITFDQSNRVELFYYYNTISLSLYQVGTFILLTALYLLMDQKMNGYYWVLLSLILSGIIINAYSYQYAQLITVVGISNLVNFEIIRIALKSLKTRKNGALIIALGGIGFALFWGLFILSLIFNFLYTPFAGTIFTIGDVVFNLATLSIPVAVCVYFGLDIALTNKALRHKLMEVETLSTEKQHILSTQNETLERQVAERTAELSSKNRELAIEAALERVRSRTMAMQKSNELADCTQLLFRQIQGLELPFFTCGFTFIEESLDIQRGWTVSPDGTLIPDFIDFPLTGDEVLDQRYESWKQKNPLHIADIHGEANKAHHQFLASKVPSSFADDIIAHLPDRIIFYSANFSQGNILILATEFLKKEEEQVLIRFAKVFEQTYTRFLDLQKAEAQAEQARLHLIQIQTEKKRTEEALIALKSTQAQLIQSEKLASLGELTAGIAHEIQNPLNFVNNFAEVSAEMLVEMEEELDKGDTQEAKAIAADLKTNLEKINHHGKRASSIVKSMLEHSRQQGKDAMHRVSTDINALADEYLRLAYHGLRAKDSSFQADYELIADPNLPNVEVVPQDMGRVLLNLINNAFYAVSEKAQSGAADYKPKVTVSTALAGDNVMLKVADNGNGIPEAIREKIFQPFFTTKPTGQGTGLGLSLAYDMVVKGHGGALEVETKEGEGTTFLIRIPG